MLENAEEAKTAQATAKPEVSARESAPPALPVSRLLWRVGMCDRWEKLMDNYQRWVFVGLM
jgi:hypothetical protein